MGLTFKKSSLSRSSATKGEAGGHSGIELDSLPGDSHNRLSYSEDSPTPPC